MGVSGSSFAFRVEQPTPCACACVWLCVAAGGDDAAVDADADAAAGAPRKRKSGEGDEDDPSPDLKRASMASSPRDDDAGDDDGAAAGGGGGGGGDDGEAEMSEEYIRKVEQIRKVLDGSETLAAHLQFLCRNNMTGPWCPSVRLLLQLFVRGGCCCCVGRWALVGWYGCGCVRARTGCVSGHPTLPSAAYVTVVARRVALCA